MVSKSTHLTLDSGAGEEAAVFDALPYVDAITADDRRQAEELIKEEVCTCKPVCLVDTHLCQHQ